MKYFSLSASAGLLMVPAVFALQSRLTAPAAVPSAARERIAVGCATTKGLARVICLAEAFKATLNSSQVAELQRPYSKADAVRWSNFPQPFAHPQRVGLGFGTLNATQLAAAKALMAAVLVTGVPNEGFDELEGGLAADDYLGKATKKTDVFGSGNYYIAFLGAPSATGQWELQYGGHHYAFANTYKNGKVVGVTPTFRGVEPMTAVTAHGYTYQPAEQERQAFAALLGGLSSSEQASARLATTFTDVLLGPGQDGQFPNKRLGLRVGSLSAAKQQLVLAAMKRYVNDLEPATAAPILAGYTAQLADTGLHRQRHHAPGWRLRAAGWPGHLAGVFGPAQPRLSRHGARPLRVARPGERLRWQLTGSVSGFLVVPTGWAVL
jgi:hypothetical protein